GQHVAGKAIQGTPQLPRCRNEPDEREGGGPSAINHPLTCPTPSAPGAVRSIPGGACHPLLAHSGHGDPGRDAAVLAVAPPLAPATAPRPLASASSSSWRRRSQKMLWYSRSSRLFLTSPERGRSSRMSTLFTIRPGRALITATRS